MKNWFVWAIAGIIFLTFTVVGATLLSVPPVEPSNRIFTDKVVTVPLNGNQPRIIDRPLLSITAGAADTLFLFGEVGDANSEQISQAILSRNDSVGTNPILLVIDSPGGAVFAGSKIISAIEASKRPVYTVCYGLCASMAAMIHQYGTKRFMVNRSILMFHNASGGAQGEVTKMLSQLLFVQNFCLKMDYYIAERAGMEFEEFRHLLSNEIWIDSQDAMNMGFSDRIVSLNLSHVDKSVLLPFSNRTKHAAERIEVK